MMCSLSTRTLPLTCVLLLAGCASYQPRIDAEADFIQRAVVEERNGLRVHVAVPTRKEATRYLGADVGKRGIQPVWIKVENHHDQRFVLLPIAADPDYFSPAEAAWKSRRFLRPGVNRRMAAHFDDQQVPVIIEPESAASGLIYTNYGRGVKFVEIDLRGRDVVHRIAFQIEIPGYEVDYQQVDFENLYAADEIREVDGPGLKTYLESLPCCALGGDQRTPGDPLNIAVVAPVGGLGPPFLRQGWDVTETTRLRTVFGTIASSLLGRVYKNSPVSALYVFGRPQDLALQKARETVDERNHLRLWLTPVFYRGNTVWIGQISRDIGVRLSRKTLTTHKIDPDTDEARFYLLQDLINSTAVEAVGFVKGVGAASRNAPRENFTGDPYYTDGLRAVFFFGTDHVAFEEIDWLEWENPAAYVHLRTAPPPQE